MRSEEKNINFTLGCFSLRSIISFTLNGKFGSEYGYRTFVGVRRGLAFYPALSIGAFQQCRVNFGGEPFKYHFQPRRLLDHHTLM